MTVLYYLVIKVCHISNKDVDDDDDDDSYMMRFDKDGHKQWWAHDGQ